MNGREVAAAIRKLNRDRSDERARLMSEYDKTVYHPAMKALLDQCPHDEVTGWFRNGIGWSWKECKWCGHRIESAPTDEVGGTLDGDRY